MAETTKKAASKPAASSAKPAAKNPAAKAAVASTKPAAKTPTAKAASPTTKPAAKKPAVAAKPVVAKKSATPAVAAKVPSKVMIVSDEQRYRMVAEAAYYRAESNQFKSDPVRDWIEAESDIAALLSGTR